MAENALISVAIAFLVFATFHGFVHALLLCARLLRFLLGEVYTIWVEILREVKNWRRWL